MIPNQRATLCLLVSAVMFGAACSTSRSATRHDGRPARADAIHPGGSRQLLAAVELTAASGSNALAVVEALRPDFLRHRGGLHAPRVFVDHMPAGGVEELRRIPVASIREIRYLSAREATQQFGTGHSGGVIHVLSVTGPR